MASITDLHAESLEFEQRHTSRHRYFKFKSDTLLKALAASKTKLKFPVPRKRESSKNPLTKPESGEYHLVRFIPSDLKLDVFGERFSVPPETRVDFVVAAIDVKEQKMQLFLDSTRVEEFDYKLR